MKWKLQVEALVLWVLSGLSLVRTGVVVGGGRRTNGFVRAGALDETGRGHGFYWAIGRDSGQCRGLAGLGSDRERPVGRWLCEAGITERWSGGRRRSVRRRDCAVSGRECRGSVLTRILE